MSTTEHISATRADRLAIVAASLLIVGIQIFFSSFLLSILGLRRRCGRPDSLFAQLPIGPEQGVGEMARLSAAPRSLRACCR